MMFDSNSLEDNRTTKIKKKSKLEERNKMKNKLKIRYLYLFNLI